MPMPSNDQPSALRSMRGTVLAGSLTALAFFGGLGSWAAFAPLDSAALAPGVVSVASQRKTIQHLEGGIITKILVAEGDRVEAGQALLRLDRTQSRSTLERLRTRHAAAVALDARLTAERDDKAFLLQADADQEPALRDALKAEASIFNSRKETLAGQQEIIEQRILQHQKEIVGLTGQMKAESAQLGLVTEELKGLEQLRKQKLVSKQRLIELKRELARLTGSRSRHAAAIARAEQSIAEERLKIVDLRTRRTTEAVAELRDNRSLLLDLEERIQAAEDILQRTHITAPLSGVVVGLKVHTEGGVVAPGEALMDIVPDGEKLMVEARVQPEDIDAVHAGLEADITLTAFSRRNVPPVRGSVVSISADRLTDARSGEPYFLARITLPETPYPGNEALQLYPGMQADVMIVIGERTPLDYLFKPVARSFDRAMRED